MARKIVRPQYETKHEEMLAEEREYAMWLQDKNRMLAGVLRTISGVQRVIGLQQEEIAKHAKQ
jgi:hypothetical protein